MGTPARAAAKKHVILFLAANPTGTDRLALDREARSIRAELKRSGYRDRFEFETRWAAEPLANAGDIIVTATELRVTVAPLSSPHGTAALAALCAELDALAPRFPGIRLRVRYAVTVPKPDSLPPG